jgi:nitrogen fixation-related uncharacterized protein
MEDDTAGKASLWARLTSKIMLVTVISFGLLFFAWYIHTTQFDDLYPQFASILEEACKTIGATGLALVALNFWIETDDWRRYFEERIKTIVVEQDYMRTLEPATLDGILRNVMKARFKGVVVDRENGFLDHFENNLQKYVAFPFREDIISVIRYEEQDDGSVKFIDSLEYICRKIGKSIQESVKYQLDPGEKLDKIEISVYRPQGDGFGPKQSLFSKISVDQEAIDSLREGIPLLDYTEIDGLKVVIDSVAFQDPKSFSFWRIAHPGRNVDISIMFPVIIRYHAVYSCPM